jgi:hypothetical protein
MTKDHGAKAPPTHATDLDIDTLRELTGTPPFEKQGVVFDTSEIETRPTGITDQELDEGESGPTDEFGAIVSADQLELLEDTGLRSDETDDPYVASDEGLPYVPPSDPVVVPSGNPEGIEIAAGMGVGATDRPHEFDGASTLLPAEDDMTARVREAIRDDATTTAYADFIEISTDGRTVWLRGVVEDIDDEDNIVAVVTDVLGVAEVIDELAVAGL